jgi:hypothetical protein
MAIYTLISTPACYTATSPPVVSRWVATESPNIFRLLRQDWTVNSQANAGGYLQVVVDGTFTGLEGDSIQVYNETNNEVLSGTITAIAGNTITTDILWVAGTVITYLNDNTLYPGFYFEGRLTINGILEELTIYATPDRFGYADIDISGLLRIKTSRTKLGNYTTDLTAETVKSGRFSFEYRPCWFGSDNEWIPEGGSISPPSDEILWYYCEAVRSAEQGSNLQEYVPNENSDVPFFNQFERPVYFFGLPFDISFILPSLPELSPSAEIVITKRIYNSVNTQLGADIVTYVNVDSLSGYLNSLNVNQSEIPEGAAYILLTVTLP